LLAITNWKHLPTADNYEVGWLCSKDARWYICKPKIPLWVNFKGLGMEKVGIFFGHLEYITDMYFEHFTAIWYISPRFGILRQE
jgi:hypothetical protein